MTARQKALNAFLAGVKAADPADSLAHGFQVDPLRPAKGDGVTYFIATGKAACKMMQAALDFYQPARFEALAITNPENACQIENCEVISAGHPVPDAQGMHGVARIFEMLKATREKDRVIVLLSGGSSALLPAPVAGISLSDKITVNEVLLGSGLNITDMNVVRQSLSRLKGGGLLMAAQPAPVQSYILSDVIGDDLRVVGSGPSIGAVGNPAQAAALLKKADVWHAMPPATRTYLTTAQAPPMQHAVHATLIASNATSAQAVADYLATKMQTAPLIGDVEQAAQRIVNDALAYSTPLVYGGETTVELSKVVGKGGRNQELALRVVRLVKRAGLTGDWCFLSGGTDGRDGPTDAAGGLVDHTSFARLEAASIDLDRVLERHDSYPALAVIDDLLMTGATGTNVADLQIFLRPSPKT